MKYNEWRDELYNNLLSVSENERRRVLDYYAEAYADRRDAGFSEREIIDEFGAPYDAARRILSDGAESAESEKTGDYGLGNEKHGQRREERRKERSDGYARQDYGRTEFNHADYAPRPAPKRNADYSWVFVLLCVIFAIPIFFVVLGMIIVTVAFCAAPMSLLISGVATIGAGVGAMFADPLGGALTAFLGLIIFGISLILLPLCFQLVKLMWTLFKKFFTWLKNLFVSRRATV